MQFPSYDNETFNAVNGSGQTISRTEYQSCTFKRCDFSNSDFSGTKFLDCTFDGCNLSMAKLNQCTLNDVHFKNCKILGVNFTDAQDFLFSVSFEGCILDYASFMRKKMPKTRFVKSSVKEANFSNTILTGSIFDDCDLMGAIFNRTDLTSANFVTAYNFDIEPDLNALKKASFSSAGLAGLLTKYGIKIV